MTDLPAGWLATDTARASATVQEWKERQMSAVKEPGQMAYETFRDLVPALYPWNEIAPSVKAYWAAVEAAARAEGMREAARIAAGLGEQWVTEWRKGLKCDSSLEAFSDAADEIEAAILSAIGDSRHDGQ